MTRRSRNGVAALLCGVVLALVAALPVAHAYPPVRCSGTVRGLVVYSHLHFGGDFGCPTAKRLTRSFLRTHHSPRGYSCRRLGGIPAYCHSRRSHNRNFFARR